MKYSWKNLLLEPYRPLFFVGSLMAILVLAYWFITLILMQQGDSYAFATRSVYQVHAHEMYYCIFAYFAFGFLLTAFPRFIEVPHPKPSKVVLWTSGLLLSEIALILGLFKPPAFYLSFIAQLLVYASVLFFLWKGFIQSKTTWREQPRLILMAFSFGLLGSVLGNLALIRVEWIALRLLSIEVGLYGYILFLIFAVTWRVVPFFSSRVLPGYEMKRGRYSGKIILGLLVLRIGLRMITLAFPTELSIQEGWFWLIDTGVLLAFALEVIHWQPWKAKSFPPLFILYLGLFWLFVFLAISPLRLFAHFYLPDGDMFFLAHHKNFLHIFNLGTFGTLILAISSRVTRGHGGLPLKFDAWMGLALLFMQLAMIVRVLDIRGTMHYATLFWIGSFSLWAWRHIPILWHAPIGKET